MQKLLSLTAILLGCGAFVVGVTASADTVELSGGHLSGKVRRVAQEKVPYIVVIVDADLRIAIPESSVRRVVMGEELAEYRRQAAAAADNADQHYELAKWCTEHQLKSQRRYHMQRAIELDPDHAKARAALGYTMDNNVWVRRDELQRNRGMISDKGNWKLPEKVAADRQAKEDEITAKKWISEIAKRRKVAMGTGDAAALASQELMNIVDPLAAGAIARELLDPRMASAQPASMRNAWIKLLGRFHNRLSIEALVRVGLQERDEQLRAAALEELQKFGSESAVATYLGMLRNPSTSNDDIQRAARALSFFSPDPEWAFTLVNALVTEHKHVIPAGAGTQSSFGSDGSAGLNTGSKQQVLVETRENLAVLTVLKMIEPEVDYGFSQSKWRQHFSDKLMAFSGDLRRDP